MSLINDALKQARKAQPRNLPTALPPLQPVAGEPPSVASWLVPAMVISLVVAGIFSIGWAFAHHTVQTVSSAPPAIAEAPPKPVVALPVVALRPAEPPPPPRVMPKLQGIFYSPTAPTAIVNGKTIRPGDQFRDYTVKSISKYTVTLIGPDKKDVVIGMSN